MVLLTTVPEVTHSQFKVSQAKLDTQACTTLTTHFDLVSDGKFRGKN